MKVDITGAIAHCPFCGSTPTYKDNLLYDGYYGDHHDHVIKCENCRIETHSDNVYACLANWNRLGGLRK